MELKVRNVNQAFAEAWWKLRVMGQMEASRNGPVLAMPEPVMTVYSLPQERVLFNKTRDCNHVFHLVEAIWMLAGRDDVEPLLPYNSNYTKYAEKDGVVHGAYGHRWRRNFDYDQVISVIELLRKDPTTRRAVIAMWDPNRADMEAWKDTPCNTHIYFEIRQGQLNMTVCCRSNDALWGAYGANVVHFSMLQELIALELKVAIGVYRQFSNNFHVYTQNEMASHFLSSPPDEYQNDPYSSGKAVAYPMLTDGETAKDFLADCARFMRNETCHTRFLRDIVQPLADAYRLRKDGVDYRALLDKVPGNCDWRLGFEQWTEKRDGKGVDRV